MAKIRIHELAKELDKQSKEIQSFLQGQGIEAKSASSSVEENVAESVRKAFGKGEAKAAAPVEKPAEEAKLPERENVRGEKPQKEEKPRRDGNPPKEENSARAAEAPKKKKTIIFVNNSQNSKMSGQRYGQGSSSGRPQEGQRKPQRGNSFQNNGHGDRRKQNAAPDQTPNNQLKQHSPNPI